MKTRLITNYIPYDTLLALYEENSSTDQTHEARRTKIEYKGRLWCDIFGFTSLLLPGNDVRGTVPEGGREDE